MLPLAKYFSATKSTLATLTFRYVNKKGVGLLNMCQIRCSLLRIAKNHQKQTLKLTLTQKEHGNCNCHVTLSTIVSSFEGRNSAIKARTPFCCLSRVKDDEQSGNSPAQ